VDLPQRKNRGALAAGRSIAIRNREIGRDKRPSDSDTRTTGGFADGDEFQAITTAEYFNDGTRLRGGCPKGRPPRERTTPASIIYYVTLGGEGERGGVRRGEVLLRWWRRRDPPTVSFSTLAAARVHHRTLFIRQNLNYTFDRTSQRPPPSCCRSKCDVAMLNALRRAFKAL